MNLDVDPATRISAVASQTAGKSRELASDSEKLAQAAIRESHDAEVIAANEAKIIEGQKQIEKAKADAEEAASGIKESGIDGSMETKK